MKICINIYSDYKLADDNNCQVWLNEIVADSTTVHSVFNDATGYRVINIAIPAGRNNQDYSIIKTLQSINFSGVKECHLVLNTHGAAGNSDLSDNVIKDVLRYLSNIEIKVNALTALQCNAFKGETLEAAEKRIGYKQNDRFGSLRLHPSSMKILQGKLNNLELKMAQKFVIRGFDKPYCPIADKNEVIDLLQGIGGRILEVHTRESERREKKIEKIKNAIDYVNAVNSQMIAKDFSRWNIATNCLSIVFKEMLEDIKCHFNAVPPLVLSAASQCLYERIKQYSISQNKLKVNADFANNKEFLIQYKAWSKNNLIKEPVNNNRLDLLTAYCNAQPNRSETRYSERLNFFALNNSTNRKEETTSTIEPLFRGL